MDTEQKVKRVLEALEKIKEKYLANMSFNDGIDYSIRTIENWFDEEIEASKKL